MRTNLPESPHCPRCGLRGAHECLDSRNVVYGASSMAITIEAGVAKDYRERRWIENQKIARARTERKTSSHVVRS